MTNAFACDLVRFLKFIQGLFLYDGWMQVVGTIADGFVDTNPDYYGMFLCRKCREKFL